MIELQLAKNNPLKIQINCENYNILKDMREWFTHYAPNYQFSPKYQAGVWNGKICIMDVGNRQILYGLLTDLLRFKKMHYPDVKLKIDDDVKKLFKTTEKLEYEWDLKWPPREYQEDCIRTVCNYSKSIFRVGTGGGKSLILAYIWKSLFDNNLISKQIIIVPNLNLITQFKEDWIDYGIDPEYIGEVWADVKEWDKKVVVSTWQSLDNHHDKLDMFDSVFVDEVHMAKAQTINNLLSKMSNAKYRVGCTGTLPDDTLDDLNIRSYLGPVVKEYDTKFLRDNKFVAPCTINKMYINYLKKYTGDFHKAKLEIFQNPFRMNLIKDILLSIKENVSLVLVGKVEDEGKYLESYLHEFLEFENHEIVFLSGKTKKNDREKWRQKAIKNDSKLILISTYPILQAGVNIPCLSHVIFAAPYKSKIRILQSIGRTLRLHETKERAYIYDLIDLNNKWFSKHADVRDIHYERESFDVVEYEFYEKPNVENSNNLKILMGA